MDYTRLFSMLKKNGMKAWADTLEIQLSDYFKQINHGDYAKWQKAIDALPSVTATSVDLNTAAVCIGEASDCSDEQRFIIEKSLKQLMPWRKGPFDLFGLHVNSEWRSDLKWARLENKIRALDDKLILDIGCGNGYYAWRMLGQGARYVVGLDPTLLFLMQFNALKKFVPGANISVLPFGIQLIADMTLQFDTVFSMGVIYHRRDPIEHLQQLGQCLKVGGELVLETLIIECENGAVLKPKGRYAKMNNVWAIPNPDMLLDWVNATGFKNARIIDISRTTDEEQRVTEWMQFESLADFLDKEDRGKTIEGYPAPVRAILVADK